MGVNVAYGEQREVFGVLRNEPIVFLEDCLRCGYRRIFHDVAFLRGPAFVSDIALHLNHLNAAASLRGDVKLYRARTRSSCACQRKLKLFRDVFPNLTHLTPPVNTDLKMFWNVTKCS